MGELTLQIRVAKGAALFDVKVPKWHEQIDPDRLDQGSCEDDLFSQLFEDKDYFEVRAELFGEETPAANRAAEAHGFECSIYRDDPYEYVFLTDEWRRIIIARQAQGVPA